MADAPVEEWRRVLTLQTNRNGYLYAGLHVDGTKAARLAHRLVAMAYIPNPDDLPWVDHINGDRKGNDVANLRWCTAAQNHVNRATRAFRADLGVTFCPRDKKWIARVQLQGAVYACERFDSFLPALELRNRRLTEAYGEFAAVVDAETIDLASLPQATP